MKINDFYSKRECEKKFELTKKLPSEDKRPLLLSTTITNVMDMLAENKRDREWVSHLVDFIKSSLVYEPEWFDMPGRNLTLMQDDTQTFKRMLNYLWSYRVIKADVLCSYNIGGVELEQRCHVVEKDGIISALIIKHGASVHSRGGKSFMTNTNTRLEGMVVKSTLESTYPNINIGYVFLRTSEDADGKIFPDFLVNNTKKSNLLFADYSAFYENGEWQQDAFDMKMSEVISEEIKKPCFDCKHARLCKLKSMDAKPRETEAKSYVLPQYTDEQKEVIERTEGQLCVIAGPGSGKTATLVGRIKNLKCVPEQILVITYTKKARQELLDRCSSFCKPSAMPYISTINAFALEVLRANGQRYRTLTPTASLELIEALLYSQGAIKGVKYGKKYGRTGTLKTVERKIQAYQTLGAEAFLAKEREFDYDFIEFADSYLEAVHDGGYITYDEMITLCIKLFKENPDILEGYRNLYRYIMVDEFQDVNAANCELIYMLAGKNGNLCVVGDDDQAIYGFRGGSNKYMLEFKNAFPDAEVKIFTKNFRSTSSIVKASAEVIQGNERFNKEITAARGAGVKPLIVADSTPGAMDEAVAELLSKGYSYGDIAILSTKNDPLEQLHDKMQTPTVLAKTYLVDSYEFIILSSLLKIMGNADEISNEVMLPLVAVFDSEIISSLPDGNIYKIMQDGIYPALDNFPFYSVLETENREGAILKKIALLLNEIKHSNLENIIDNLEKGVGVSPATAALRDLIKERDVKSIDALSHLMEQMVLMQDDERVDIEIADAVTLITTHESKGKEWPCVILQNLEDYKSEAESRRMLYVACTRAKDRLILCHETKSRINIPLTGDAVDVAV